MKNKYIWFAFLILAIATFAWPGFGSRADAGVISKFRASHSNHFVDVNKMALATSSPIKALRAAQNTSDRIKDLETRIARLQAILELLQAQK